MTPHPPTQILEIAKGFFLFCFFKKQFYHLPFLSSHPLPGSGLPRLFCAPKYETGLAVSSAMRGALRVQQEALESSTSLEASNKLL